MTNAEKKALEALLYIRDVCKLSCNAPNEVFDKAAGLSNRAIEALEQESIKPHGVFKEDFYNICDTANFMLDTKEMDFIFNWFTARLNRNDEPIIKTLEAAESSIAAFESLLPSQKLVDHAKWQRKEIRKTLKMLEGKE